MAFLSIWLSISFIFGLLAYLAVGKEQYDIFIKNSVFLSFMSLVICIYSLFFIVRYISISSLFWKYIAGLKNRLGYKDIIPAAIFYFIFSMGFNRIFFYYLSFVVPSYVENYLNKGSDDNLLSNILLYGFGTLIMYFLLELIFNVIVLHKISLKKGIITGLLISSLIGSFLAVETFILFFVARIIVGLLYVKTKNIMTAILFKFLITLLKYIYLFYFHLKSDPKDFISLSEYQKIAEASLGYRFLFIVISLPYLIYFIYKNWPTQNQMLPYFANEHKNFN